MDKKAKALILVVAMAVIVTLVALAWAGPKTKVTGSSMESGPRTYSIATFLKPDWEIAMHETFTHYLQAAKTFGEGDYQMSIAFLKCMEYYINYLPNLVPDKTPPPESRPINKRQFLRDIEELRQNTIKLRRLVEMKDYKKATEVAPDAITKLCFDCHKDAKVPPNWQLGGYKIEGE